MKPGKFADLKPKRSVIAASRAASVPRKREVPPSPVIVTKVHKAELNGIRGTELSKVFKRARKS